MLSHFSHVRLYDPMDCSQPGSSVLGIHQARILKWLPCPPPGILSYILKKKKRTMVIETACYWLKSRHKDQWKGIESPEINPCTYSYLILDKGAKNTQWQSSKTISSIKDARKIGYSHIRVKLDSYLIPLTKMNSKWIKYLNVTSEIIKEIMKM